MEDKSKSIFGEDFIVFKKKEPKTITKAKRPDNNDKSNAIIKIRQKKKYAYNICEIKRVKKHGMYKEDSSIKYANTDYIITTGEEKFYFASSNSSFDIYKQSDDSRYMEFLAGGVILNYMFPIYAIKARNTLYMVLNSPLSDDITREVKPDKNGVIKARGGCNIIKVNLKDKSQDIVYQLPSKGIGYSLTAVADKKDEPNILVLVPKNKVAEKAMPKSMRGLFRKHFTGELHEIDKDVAMRSNVYSVCLKDSSTDNLFFTEPRDKFDFTEFILEEDSNNLVVIREKDDDNGK